jgi:hypothetical protein
MGRNKHKMKFPDIPSLMFSCAFRMDKLVAFFSVFLVTLTAAASFAGATEVNDLAESMVDGASELPGLVAAFSYVLGVLLGITGLLKIKEHAENPTQTPLRTGVIRLIVGGMLFSLPIIFEAAKNTFGAGELNITSTLTANNLSGLLGTIVGSIPIPTISSILDNFLDSVDEVPGLISAVAYLLAITITVIGVLKLKDHVENPEQTALKEAVIRLLVGGALFAIPSIYNSMFDLAGGNSLGIMGSIASLVGGLGFLWSSYAQSLCVPDVTVDSTGDMLCNIIITAGSIPAFLTLISYLFGLVLGVWGILKIRDHVLNPQQTGVYEGISRLIAGGLFFAMPVVVEVARNTFTGGILFQAMSFVPISISGYNDGGPTLPCVPVPPAVTCAADIGLDKMLANFMSDLMGPIHVVLNFFTFCVGLIFLMIGVSRLIKSAQDGARGPGGMGTIMTFVVGAALISYNELMRAFSTSLFSSPVSLTYATLEYTSGMAVAETAAANAVFAAILKFVILIGLISFVRGLFIIRSVAEGNQQASVMAGVTHIVAGAAAVNLGPLIEAVQGTLGITDYGITFSLL